jgi:hypothetical protein
MDFDEYIVEAVKSHTPENPQDLVGILYHVDGRMKLVMSHEELAGGLQRLIECGRIAELPSHKFYEVTVASAPRKFSGLTLEEYRGVCEAYRKRFWKSYRG